MADIAVTEDVLDGAGGRRIFVRSWRLADARPRAILVISHGFNSHSGQYDWAARKFAEAGFAVYAADLRGRGKSDGERFWVTDVAEYVGDVDLAVKLAKDREPGLQVFMLGHSAGGVVACTYVLDKPGVLSGLICESFAFRVPAPEFALDAITWLSGLLPRLPVLKLKNEDFSRDPAAVAALNADPLIANEIQPAKTVAALWRADRRLEHGFQQMMLPLLIVHGTADKATLPEGSEKFMAVAGARDKTIKLYEGHFHDLLADTGKEGVVADMIAWLGKRIGA